MFIRVYRPKEEKEILISLNHIWKIEVSYAVEGETNYFRTNLKHGIENPKAVRVYEIYVGGDLIRLISDPDDPVINEVEKLYNSAVKN